MKPERVPTVPTTPQFDAGVERALHALRNGLLGGLAPGAVAPDGTRIELPLDRVDALIKLDDQVRKVYVALRAHMLFGPGSDAPLGRSLLANSQALYANLSLLFAGCARRLITAEPSGSPDRVAMLAVRAASATTEHVKWAAFEHVTVPGASWLALHALHRALEGARLCGHAIDLVPGDATSRTTWGDAYAQCLLLGTLNVGVLTPSQVEIGHRWITDMARAALVARTCEERVHTHRVRLDAPSGPVRITDIAVPDDDTLFLGGGLLERGLADTRRYLYAGALTAKARNPSAAALDYGAFLDLADRLWSPEWRKVAERAPREVVRGVTLDAVLGIERVIAAIENTHAAESPDPQAPVALEIDWPDEPASGSARSNVVELPGRSTARWVLRDRSETGIGALVPSAAAAALAVGTLIGFRAGDALDWEIGMLVRRIAADESGETLLGIKRLSANPVHVRLRLGGPSAPSLAATDALFAPMQTRHTRIDALIVPVSAFATTDECALQVGDDAYQIRLDRILDRGEGWLRVGFEILAKGNVSGA